MKRTTKRPPTANPPIRAQETPAAREPYYRVLFESAGDAIFLMQDEVCVDCNQKALELFGCTLDQMLATRPSALSPPRQPDGRDSQEAAKEKRRRALEGQPLRFEWKHRRWDGTPFDAEVTLTRVDVAGAPHLLALVKDVSEQKRAQAALRQKSQELDSFFDVSLDLLSISSTDGYFLRLNPAWEATLGYTREELQSKHFFEFVHPDDLDATKAALDALVRQQTVVDFINRYRRSDGQYRCLEWRAAPAGNVIYAAARDITERWQAEIALREREERFRMVFEEGPLGINIVGLDGKLIRANSKLCEMYGYTEEELGRVRITEFTHPDDLAKNVELTGKLLRGEISRFRVEKRFMRKDGEAIWTDLVASLVRAPDGKPLYALGMVLDITERMRALEALRESEQRYRDFIEHSIEGVWRLEMDPPLPAHLPVEASLRWLLRNGTIAECNQAHAHNLGFKSAQEVIGKKLCELIPLTDDERLETFREAIHHRPQSRTVEFRGHDKTGAERIFLRTEIPIFQQGDLVRVWGITRDITEVRQAEIARRESEERFRATFENAGIGIALVDLLGHPIKSNPALRQMLGYGEEELTHMSFLEFTHRDDRDLDWGLFGDLLAGRIEKYSIEKRYLKKDGSLLWGMLTASTVKGPQGDVLYIVGMIEDITERKRADAALQESEGRFRTLVENAPVGIYRTTPDGRILAGNPALVRMLGYSSFQELAARNLNTTFFEPQYPRSDFMQRLEKHGKVSGLECSWKAKDGGELHVRENARAIRDASGQTLYYEGTVEDISERKTLEAQLQQAAKIEAVGRLAGGVAHDFNNLLTIINGYSEMLMEGGAASPDAETFVKEIRAAGTRAASLTRQLLAFSRRQVLAPQVIDLNAVIANLEKMLKRLIGEDIRLRTVLDPALARTKADPGQIEQVIMNLVVNARDAMPAGGQITVETSSVELDEEYARTHATVKPGPHVMLAVTDTGEGMSPETQARIFEPFFTTKEQDKGTGLGLATVYGIVKQSGGNIWVYSELGRGTVFKVYLPAADEDLAVTSDADSRVDSAAGWETILVVEDEAAVRSLIHNTLVASGYAVLETDGAEKALATCTSHQGPIHLLLTDVVMPQMSGPMVAEKAAALRPGLKVLYMSGYTDDAILRHGVLTRDLPFIQKPFSPVSLRKKVREVLGGE